jgi:hypothetical protein
MKFEVAKHRSPKTMDKHHLVEPLVPSRGHMRFWPKKRG